MVDFPTRSEDIDARWLQSQLDRAGVLDGATITRFDVQPIGTGQVGDTVRITLHCDRATTAPASIAAKLPSRDETSRSTAAQFSLYRREVHFYQEIAPLITMRVPRTYAAMVDPTGADFILLFEDLGPARIGNQLNSCSLADARLAVIQAASLHASTDNLPALEADWLQPDLQARAMVIQAYPQAQAIFRERYRDQMESDFMCLCDELAEACETWFSFEASTRCVTHGDFRLDNMLFDIRGGAEPIALVDWQTCGMGGGTTDLGYFLGTGIGHELRRAHEGELIDLYCAEMTRHGAARSRDQIFDDYRIGALHGLATAVFSAAFVERTPRGDANFLSMARGACSLVQEHNSLGTLLRHRETAPC